MDGRKILLDCGWDDHMDVQALEPLRRIAPQVDAVLISHPDTAHLGALPYAFGTLGMACKVYATLPVHKMGMMFMYDQFLARAAEGDFNLFSLDDVDRAFGAFVPVRYAQHSALDFPTRADSRVDGRAETANETKTSSGAEGGSEDASDERPGAKKNESVSGAKYAPSGITVTAYAAGHTLGGAVWKLHKDAEDIVYAVDYNHRREKHLNGTTLDSINRPSLLITDAFNALGEPTPKTRDDDLMRAVLRAVRSDGNVLIPVDPAGRVLELLLLLEERWAKQQLGAYQLVLLTTVAYNTMEFARSHLEWMGENVGRNFDRDRLNAFNTRYLTLCHSLEELRNLRPGPKVVLASFGSLEAGPARALFAEWAEDPKNLVVLADRGAPGSLSRRVRALAEQPPGARKPLEVRVSRRVLLEGAELEAWRLKRKDERLSKQARLIAEEKAREEEAEKEKEKLPSEETMEVDDETQTGAIQEPAAAAAAESLLGVAQISGADTRAAELRRRRCLIDGFEVPADAAAPVFPDEVWDPIVDDFGEAVDTDAFARAVALSARAAGASDAAIAQAEGAAKAAADAAGAAKAAAQPKAIPPPAPPPMPEEVPSKIESHAKHVQLRAAVHCCDYEGRADGRSVKTLVARVEPRRVVLVHGAVPETDFLRATLRASMPGVEVDAPGAGEAVDCTSDTAAYKLELSQELLQRTRLRDCAGYQVGWVDGVVGFAENAAGEEAPVLMAPPKEAAEAGGEGGSGAVATADAPSPDTPSRGEDVSTTTAAAAVAVATAASKERRQSAFVGDLKLTDFKITLASAGVAAEFRGGALVCAGGAVCVRKSSESENLQVEGALCDAFYRVRDILYASYQV